MSLYMVARRGFGGLSNVNEDTVPVMSVGAVEVAAGQAVD
jgi:hypothetical protein